MFPAPRSTCKGRVQLHGRISWFIRQLLGLSTFPRRKGPSRSEWRGEERCLRHRYSLACSAQWLWCRRRLIVLWFPDQSTTSPVPRTRGFFRFPITTIFPVKQTRISLAGRVYFLLCCRSKNWHLQGMDAPACSSPFLIGARAGSKLEMHGLHWPGGLGKETRDRLALHSHSQCPYQAGRPN